MSPVKEYNTLINGALYSRGSFEGVSDGTMTEIFSAFDDAIIQALRSDGSLIITHANTITEGELLAILEYFDNHPDVDEISYKPNQIEVSTLKGHVMKFFLIFGGELATIPLSEARPEEWQTISHLLDVVDSPLDPLFEGLVDDLVEDIELGNLFED